MPSTLKIGLFGIGLDAYWSQFEGLKERLEAHLNIVHPLIHLLPGPILQMGNANSLYQFSIGARKFVNEWNSHGPAHHCAVGIGHISCKLFKLGALLNMEVVKVC